MTTFEWVFYLWNGWMGAWLHYRLGLALILVGAYLVIYAVCSILEKIISRRPS